MGFWDRWAAEVEVEQEWEKLSQDMMDVGEVISLDRMVEEESWDNIVLGGI